MLSTRASLAKIHKALGGGSEKLFQEIILEKIPELKTNNEVLDFIFSFEMEEKVKETIFKRVKTLNFQGIDEYLEKNEVKILSIFDSEYPASLRQIYDPPMILYLRGEINENFKIAIVGPRNPSVYAKEETRKIAKGLSENNITVVSGMASGIDRIAHEESCMTHSGSIGVLGAGIDVVYPKSNYDLYAKMKSFKQNLLISEFPLGFPPGKFTFPKRNRIISGLSQGVVITEGTLVSGSMITARHAYEQGRSVYALPGLVSNPLTKGVHQLIKDGATMVESAGDILEDLYPMLKIQADNKKFLNLTDIELSIVEKLQVDPQSIEEIMSFSGKNISETLRILSFLEIKGIIKKEINNKYLVII